MSSIDDYNEYHIVVSSDSCQEETIYCLWRTCKSGQCWVDHSWVCVWLQCGRSSHDAIPVCRLLQPPRWKIWSGFGTDRRKQFFSFAETWLLQCCSCSMLCHPVCSLVVTTTTVWRFGLILRHPVNNDSTRRWSNQGYYICALESTRWLLRYLASVFDLNEKVLCFVLVFEFEITILADLVDVWTYWLTGFLTRLTRSFAHMMSQRESPLCAASPCVLHYACAMQVLCRFDSLSLDQP